MDNQTEQPTVITDQSAVTVPLQSDNIVNPQVIPQPATEPTPLGAPSKYKPEYCEKLIEHMSKGYSFDSFGAVVDVCEDTLYEWKKVHLNFSDSYKKGRTLSLYEWEKMGIHATQGKPFLYKRKIASKDQAGNAVVKEVEEQGSFNATTWIFNMKNRFGWKDRTDHTSGDEKIASPWPYLPSKDNE